MGFHVTRLPYDSSGYPPKHAHPSQNATRVVEHLNKECKTSHQGGCQSWERGVSWTWMYVASSAPIEGDIKLDELRAVMLIKDDSTSKLLVTAFWSVSTDAAKAVVGQLKVDMTNNKKERWFTNPHTNSASVATLVTSKAKKTRAMSNFFNQIGFGDRKSGWMIVRGKNFPPHVVRRYVSKAHVGTRASAVDQTTPDRFDVSFETLPDDFYKNLGWDDTKKNITDKRWEELCFLPTKKNSYKGSGIPWGTWPEEALENIQYVYIAWSSGDERASPEDIVGIMLVHDCASDNTNAPGEEMCRSDELYINALCGLKSRGSGAALLSALESDIADGQFSNAADSWVTRIRLYAIKAAKEWWRNKGFLECDDACVRPCKPKSKTYKMSDELRKFEENSYRKTEKKKNPNAQITTGMVKAYLATREEENGFRMTKCIVSPRRAKLIAAIVRARTCLDAIDADLKNLREKYAFLSA